MNTATAKADTILVVEKVESSASTWRANMSCGKEIILQRNINLGEGCVGEEKLGPKSAVGTMIMASVANEVTLERKTEFPSTCYCHC